VYPFVIKPFGKEAERGLVAPMCRRDRTALQPRDLIELQAAPEASDDDLARIQIQLSQ